MKKAVDYVTRRDLREELDRFKKQDLKEGLDGLREEMRDYRDQIMTGLDGVMKELESMREDSTIGTYQIRNLREEVDDHEKRITKIESV